jgi:hypothetical protein
MKIAELNNLDEIAYTTLSKDSTWKRFDKGPYWADYILLPIRFKNYIVILDSDSNMKSIAIIDPKKLKAVPDERTTHSISGLNKDIPRDAIVGGVDLSIKRGGPVGVSWVVDYLAFNPEYQGQGLPIRFYKWIIENYPNTGIGAIKAGNLHTPGSQKLWANLSKILLVFAYEPITKQVSQVEIDDEGKLEAKFDVYPDDLKSIRDPYAIDTKLLKRQLRNKEIDKETYDRQHSELLAKQDQELIAAEHAEKAELYAVLPKVIKKRK